jgi:hypothetical protein
LVLLFSGIKYGDDMSSLKDGKSGSPKEVKAERLKAKGTRPQAERPPATDHPAPPELTTDHSQLAIEMEVHHHPQLEHKPKPWKEYLLEGLMIFVAVTMGFFAESLREHITNNEKEKQVITSLVSDLKEDTATLNKIITVYIPDHSNWVDSLDNDINSNAIRGNKRKIIMALFNATLWQTYTPPEVALNDLKSSGTFNLIEKQKAKNEILIFNTKINEYIKYSEFLLGVEHCIDTASMSIIDRKVQRRVIQQLYFNNAQNKSGLVGLKDIPDDVSCELIINRYF